MNIVLIHLGGPQPPHMKDCIAQIKKHSDAPILWNMVDEFSPERMREYEEKAGWLRREHGPFWDYAFRRLFVLEEIILSRGLTDIIHIENDVLIYSDPAEIRFPRDGRIWAAPVGPRYAAYAYTWIPDGPALVKANTRALDIFTEGKAALLERYGEGMVNEMMVLKQMMDEGTVGALPIFPEAGWPCVFDGASAGQYLGGPPGGSPGWTGEHHYLGTAIRSGVAEIADGPSGKMLRFPHTGTLARYHNLHIHCKDLRRFM